MYMNNDKIINLSYIQFDIVYLRKLFILTSSFKTQVRWYVATPTWLAGALQVQTS